jgi:hypothetical protein
MKTLLTALVRGGALVVITVSTLHITLGQSWIPGTVPVSPSLDSEHRFYTALFFMYGVALWWCAGQLAARRSVFGFLLATLFVGGVARIVSVLSVGWPHPLFIALGAVELVFPPVLWLVVGRIHST